VMVFHAGTRLNNKNVEATFRSPETESRKIVLTNGGRVLGVTALGDGIKLAIKKAYQAVELIKFKDMHFRKDIGKKALKYLK